MITPILYRHGATKLGNFMFLLWLLVVVSLRAGDDADHGRDQLKAILRDRPMMLAYPTNTGMHLIDLADIPFAWAAQQFSKTANGKHFILAWDNGPLQLDGGVHQILSEQNPPSSNTIGLLRLAKIYDRGKAKGEPLPFEHLWSSLVFELCNFENSVEFEGLYDGAANGTVPESEFIEAMARLEHQTNLKQMLFYEHKWIPWAKAKGFVSEREYWGRPVAAKFDEWRKQFTDPKGYPYVPFQESYRQLRKNNPNNQRK